MNKHLRCVFLCFVLSTALSAHAADKKVDPYLRPIPVPYPADNMPTPERIELGKMLFFDPRLSGSEWISCGTCHNPALAWTDGLPAMLGNGMAKGLRSTPTILNTAYNQMQFWDGRAKTLEEQALGPIQAPGEMNSQDMDDLVKRLNTIEGYRKTFDKAYPNEGINPQTIAKAISSFERTVVSTEAPFDKWRKGDKNAISVSAQRGFDLFTGKANCTECHQGFNFADDGFHNIGLPVSEMEDVGRFAHRKIKVNKGAFKTPTLRDVALTAPYMHNGVYKTLAEVVEHYNKGGVNMENLDPNLKPLHLNDQEKADIVAFLLSLTGKPMEMTIPHLPPMDQ